MHHNLVMTRDHHLDFGVLVAELPPSNVCGRGHLVQDHVGCIWVGQEIEFRTDGPKYLSCTLARKKQQRHFLLRVSNALRVSAHDEGLLDELGGLGEGLERQGEVGQRPQKHESHLIYVCSSFQTYLIRAVGQVLTRMRLEQPHYGIVGGLLADPGHVGILLEGDVVESVAAVVLVDLQLPPDHQGLPAPAVYRNL